MSHIKKFNHFDKLFENLILEKALIIGKNLQQILSKMKHKYASLIISNSGKDIVDSSYIEVDSEPGMITWLPSNREINFQTKKELSEPEKWTYRSRTKQPISRVLKVILNKLNIAFSDSDIEKFVNEYKALQKPSKFVLIEGDSIIKYYSDRKYTHEYEDNSSLLNSCMRTEDKRYFFTVYAKNPNVRLVVMVDEYDYVMGRAILWLNSTINDKPAPFMDRVYTAKQSYEELFKSYAIDNGWWFKVQQSSGNGEISNGKNKISSPKILITLPNLNWAEIQKPYMDTLCYYKEEFINGKFEYTLSNYNSITDWKELWRGQNGDASEVNNNYESPAIEMKILSTVLEIELEKLIPQKTPGVYMYGKSKYWITDLNKSKKRCVGRLLKNELWKRYAKLDFMIGRYEYLVRNQVSDKISNEISSNPEKYMKLMENVLTPYFWVDTLEYAKMENDDTKEFLSILLENILKNKKDYVIFIKILMREFNDDYNKLKKMTEPTPLNIKKAVNYFNTDSSRIMREFIKSKFENKKPNKQFNNLVLNSISTQDLIDALENKYFNTYSYKDIVKMRPELFDENQFKQEVYSDLKRSNYSLKWFCEGMSNNEEIRGNVLSVDGSEIIFSQKYIYRLK